MHRRPTRMTEKNTRHGGRRERVWHGWHTSDSKRTDFYFFIRMCSGLHRFPGLPWSTPTPTLPPLLTRRLTRRVSEHAPTNPQAQQCLVPTVGEPVPLLPCGRWGRRLEEGQVESATKSGGALVWREGKRQRGREAGWTRGREIKGRQI